MKHTQTAHEGAPNNNPSNRRKKRARQRALRLTLVAVAALVLILAISLSVYAFSYGKAFARVSVEGTPVGGKTQEQIQALLEQNSVQEYQEIGFDIIVEDTTRHVTAQELKVSRDAETAARTAMEIGRTGSAWTRFWTVFSCLFTEHTVDEGVLVDEDALNLVVTEIAKLDVEPVDAAYTVEENVLTLTPPVDGKKVDQEALRKEIRSRFENRSYEEIRVTPQVAEAKELDLDEVYQKVHTEPQDAKLTEANGEHTITPHVIGVDFNLEDAKKKLSETPDQKIEIALTITNPKVTTIMLEATLFKDTLSEVTTYFSPKKVNRVHNVKLAAKFINGTVLNPGETFSYNDTVGPRTAKRGFREAQIFAAGEIVDGLGGGICQVSSTLYMAAMRADMKTVSRRNHSFYVDYAPKAQDATVVYGSIDFKFQNTSPYPIKIVSYQQNNLIRVTIKGTKTETKTVKIQTKVLSTTPFTEKVVIDNTLKPGERVIKQKGQEGITMEAYRLVYDGNGNLISKTFENKTKYVPLTQIVHVGPSSSATSGSVETPSTTTPTTPEKPQTETPNTTPGTTTPETGTTPETNPTPETPNPTPETGTTPETNTDPTPTDPTPPDPTPEAPTAGT